jgi:hypothetical protein
MTRHYGKLLLLLMAAVSFPSKLPAAAGKDGAAFLNIPVGARPAALGASYTSLADDAYAATWNPAGLGDLKSTEFSAQHLSYLDTMHYEYMSLALPSGFGASVQYLGSGDIEKRDEFNAVQGDFSNSFASYNLAYGHAFSDQLSLGLTGKMIHAKLDSVSAKAFAADFGGLMRPRGNLSLAVTLTNVGSKLKFLETGDSLPTTLRAGVSFKPATQWLMTAEGAYRKSGVASFHTGVEWRPISMLSLRSGFRTDTVKELSPLAGVTTGMGLHVWGHELAYAWLPYGDLGTTHYVSLVMKFGEAQETKRNLIRYQKIKSHRLAQDSQEIDLEYMQLMELLNETEERTAQRANEEDRI